MSIIETYNPKFDIFHEDSVVIWREINALGAALERVGERAHTTTNMQIAVNMYDKYMAWRNGRAAKHEPPAPFWESNGPAIVRALSMCGTAMALVLYRVMDRKVTYRWFCRAPRDGVYDSPDRFCLCPVVADGPAGGDVRVVVTLPTNEDAVFSFGKEQMASWRKPPPTEET